MKQVRVIRLKDRRRKLLVDFFQELEIVRSKIRQVLNGLAEKRYDFLFNVYYLEKLFAKKRKIEVDPDVANIIDSIRVDLKAASSLFINGFIREWVLNFKSVISHRKQKKKASLPNPFSKHGFSIQIDGGKLKKVSENVICLVLDRHRKIFIKTDISTDKITSVRLVWYKQINEVEAHIVYNCDVEQASVNENNWLSIDLGVKNFIASATNVPEASSFVVSSGWLLSLFHWAQEKISALQSCKLYSGVNRINYYLKRRIRTNLHQITSKIIEYCLHYNIGTIIIGENVIDSLRNTAKEKKISKELRWILSKLPFGQFVQMLETKAKRYGIKVFRSDESYTSKASCFSDEPEKQETYAGKRLSDKHGLYKDTKLNKIFHSDINAAINIAKKFLKAHNKCQIKISWSDKIWRIKLSNPLKFSFAKFIQTAVGELRLNLSSR